MHPISSEEILFLIGKLKNNSPGYDEIPAKVVKAVATLICEPLAFIFNNCISTGTVPIELKMAKVIPVFKGGNNLDVNNYRPISVLPVFSKILEKAIFNRLYNFFFYSNVFYDCQFGFLPGRSTTHTLIHLTNKITEVFEEKQFGCGTFLDLSKAFDSIDHNILISKLRHYGIRGSPLSLICDYLSNRKQYVCTNDSNQKIEKLHVVCHKVPF